MIVLKNINKFNHWTKLYNQLVPAATNTQHSIYRYFSVKKMAKPKVYLTQKITTPEAIKILEEHCEVTFWAGEGPVPRNELLLNIFGMDGLFCCLNDKIDEEVLYAGEPSLKVIGSMSVGYDHLDVNEIKKRKIRMGYTPGVLTDATAELTVALLLATSRRLIEASGEARCGGWKAWSPYWMCGRSLVDSTVGVIGFGRIGQEVAKRLKSFNIKKLLYTSRSDKSAEAEAIGATNVDFDTLLYDSDFVVVTCSLTPKTRGMIDQCAFRKMKRHAFLINTSRGGIVNQDDLIKALSDKTIEGAGLDVTTPEPLPLNNKLFELPNCVILPHIGSACIRTRNQMAIITAKNIVAALKGEEMVSELIC